LANKNIVIIGGTTGIGYSAAKAFIAQGARVVIVGRNEESVSAAKNNLKENAEAFSADATHAGTLELNLTSLMLSNQAAVKKFLELKKSGTILNMSSVLGFSPSPKYFSTHAYAAAKAAIIGFSKSIASYYAKNDIRINVIAPALVETPMAQRAAGDEKVISFIKTKQPLNGGRISQPEDLDGLAVYFLSEQSKFTTGQVIAVDGGWSVSEGIE